MSRGRKTRQKFSNATFISDQRKQIYYGQQRASKRKQSEISQQSRLQFKPDNWLFWLFLLGILQSGFASPNRHKVLNPILKERINSHLKMASSLTAEQVSNGDCNKVVDAIIEAAAANDAFAARLDATLKQADFGIICGNQKSFEDSMSPETVAMFLSYENMVMVRVDNIDRCTLIHEWIHAYFHSLHNQDTYCDLASDKTKVQTSVPFYPITKDNMDEFNRWMNRGDKRVKQLFQLHMKDKAGKSKLTNDEKYQLLRAREKLAGTTPHTAKTNYPNTEAYLKHLRDSGWPKKENIKIMINDHVVEVSKIQVLKDTIEVTNHITDPIESIHFGLKFYEALCQKNEFKNDEVKAAERVAYAMQHLDKAGMQFLYPEATEFMDKHAMKCRPDEAASFKAEL